MITVRSVARIWLSGFSVASLKTPRFISSMVLARKYVLVKQFQGEPKRSDLNIVEEELRPIEDGEFIAQAEYFSVDPYMRAYMARYPVPSDMIGGQVAKIIESKNPEWPVNKHVVGNFGWRTHTIVNPAKDKFPVPTMLVPDFGDMPVSLALGFLGMPGNTAYFGLMELCKPKEGETLVVTGAAGAVGMQVGQIGKILGCNVIGFAGSDLKCKYLKDLGFDHAFNYKTVNVRQALREAAPKGIDCYFDNVGGEISSTIMNQMNDYGRIAVCGSISSYNEDPFSLPKAPLVQPALVFKQLKMEGFLVHRWYDRWEEGIQKNLQWLKEGKAQYREHRWEGFENMYEAFVGMLRGENTGKAIIKA